MSHLESALVQLMRSLSTPEFEAEIANLPPRRRAFVTLILSRVVDDSEALLTESAFAQRFETKVIDATLAVGRA